MISRIARWVLVLLALAPPASAEPSARQSIRAARLLDVRASKLVENVLVGIENGVIVTVTSGESAAEGSVVDLGDVTLFPGLIDAHSHLLADASGGYAEMLLTKSEATRALEGAAHARSTLRAGFTTVRDVENEGSGYADVALRDAIARGLVEGPRMLVATRGIVALGQYFPFGISPDLPDFPRGAQMVSGVEEARRAVREQIGNGADLIKVYADWSYPTLTPAELATIVEEAHKAGRRVACHATTVEGARNAVVAGVDSIEHGFGPDRPLLELMRRKGVWLVPTLAGLGELVTAAEDAEARRALAERFAGAQAMVRLARELGVRLGSGYDAAEARAQGSNAREILALRDAGLAPIEAIRAATLDNAELLGLEKEIGAIEPGKRADLVAVAGDPLADLGALEQVVFVMKAGVTVVGASPTDRTP